MEDDDLNSLSDGLILTNWKMNRKVIITVAKTKNTPYGPGSPKKKNGKMKKKLEEVESLINTRIIKPTVIKIRPRIMTSPYR
ncbi:MAG: hypothetical protein ACXAEF_02850 [Candidatus Thorarchaeota archaeon]|jgi:hypothetical protein